MSSKSSEVPDPNPNPRAVGIAAVANLLHLTSSGCPPMLSHHDMPIFYRAALSNSSHC